MKRNEAVAMLSIKLPGQRGATMVEYSLAMALVVGVFVLVGAGFLVAGVTRQNESISTVQNVTPCSDRLATLSGYSGQSVSTSGAAQNALCD